MTKYLILTAITAIAFADTNPAGFHFWTHADLVTAERNLAPKMDAHKFVSQVLFDEGNHRYMAVHREATGEAEYHATETDIVFVTEGDGTLVYGGKMVNARTTAPNEMRGPAIEGGVERKVSSGDVVTLPAKIPHQMKLSSGTQLNYFVVKVKTAS